jgi:hypothetical protein
LAGLSLPELLRCRAKTTASGGSDRKAVILIWLSGGPKVLHGCCRTSTRGGKIRRFGRTYLTWLEHWNRNLLSSESVPTFWALAGSRDRLAHSENRGVLIACRVGTGIERCHLSLSLACASGVSLCVAICLVYLAVI